MVGLVLWSFWKNLANRGSADPRRPGPGQEGPVDPIRPDSITGPPDDAGPHQARRIPTHHRSQRGGPIPAFLGPSGYAGYPRYAAIHAIQAIQACGYAATRPGTRPPSRDQGQADMRIRRDAARPLPASYAGLRKRGNAESCATRCRRMHVHEGERGRQARLADQGDRPPGRPGPEMRKARKSGPG